MIFARRFLLPMFAAALLVQPACLLTSSHPEAIPITPPGYTPPPASEMLPVPQSTPVATTSEHKFAELIRAPGERLPMNAEVATVEGRSVAQPVEPVKPAATVSEPPPLPPLATPPPPDAPVVAAVRAFVNNDAAEAEKQLRTLDKPNQELMLQLIPALVQASRMNLTQASPTEVGVLVGQLQAPADALASKVPLGIEKACFCRWVKNFGRFEPLPEGHTFKPGAVAELYVEVRNVPSTPAKRSDEQDGFVTQLACTLQLRDTNGSVVELTDRNRHPVPALTETKRDFTRSPIRDYFLLFRFPVPTSPGSYSVSVEVRDPATGRAVSRVIPVRVQP